MARGSDSGFASSLVRVWISDSDGASSLQRERDSKCSAEPMAQLSCGPVPDRPFVDSIYPVRETVESALSAPDMRVQRYFKSKEGRGPAGGRTKFCSIGTRELRYLPETGNLERRSRC